MKYALLIFAFAIFSISSSYARSIKSFSDSQALLTISAFMIDTASDSPSSYRISDKKLKLKDTSACVDVNASVVIKEVKNAINGVLRLYPDEELPVDEAISDLTDYLENSSYKMCIIYQDNSLVKMKTIYFFDSSDKKHVKVDTVLASLE